VRIFSKEAEIHDFFQKFENVNIVPKNVLNFYLTYADANPLRKL